MVASKSKKNGSEPDVVAANRNALREAVAATLAAHQGGDLLKTDDVDIDEVTDRFLARLQVSDEPDGLVEDLISIKPEAVTSASAYYERLKRLLRKEVVQGELNGNDSEMTSTKNTATKRTRSKRNSRARQVKFSWDAIDQPDPSGWLSENAMAVLERRYLSKDRAGKTIEDTRGMFQFLLNRILDDNFLPYTFPLLSFVVKP